MSTPRLTAEELARKLAKARGLRLELTVPEPWCAVARAAADALGQELAPEREKLAPCPACRGWVDIGCAGHVLCFNSKCGVVGPICDPTGSKWNAMCRRLSAYCPPRELEERHPRPWQVELNGDHGEGAMIVDADGKFTVGLTLVDGDYPLLPDSREAANLSAMLAAYNAAGDGVE